MSHAATREEIAGWFDEGVRRGDRWMLVCCDTFDYEDYPVYVQADDDPHEAVRQHRGVNMQDVHEVYNLGMNKQTQLNEPRSWHLPRKAEGS